MSAMLWSLGSAGATLAGGLCALALHDRPRLLLGFGAGALLGVVGFDLLPEMVELAQRADAGAGAGPLAALAGWLLVHALHRGGTGWAPALGVVGHSVIDGLGIGLAFQRSDAAGLVVALAVVAHDFCDGLAAVGLVLGRRRGRAGALVLLLLDAGAPLLGAAIAGGGGLASDALALAPGFLAGMLLHAGLSSLLHQARHADGTACAARLAGCAGLGVAVVGLATKAIA